MKKCLCIVIIMLICLISTSCSNNKSDLSQKADSSQVTLDKKQINEIIDAIELEVGIMSTVDYRFFKNESKELYRIGIEGVPVLINKLEKREYSNNSYKAFWIFGIYSILRIDRDLVMSEYSYIIKLDYFKQFLLDSRSRIPAIINSNESIEQKIDKLRMYGLLTIPYIKKMVPNCEILYMPLFYSIGLHLQTDEWMEFYSYRNDENWYKSDEFMRKTETFNYFEWLNKNWESLDKVHTYINNYVQ